MAVVRNRTDFKSPGILATFPETMMIAMASPMARPTPRTMDAAIPLLAAGRETRKYVSVFVAPRARDAASYSGGPARSAVSETLMIDGRIIMASTTTAASRQAPDESPNSRWIVGTSTIIPTRP